MMTFGIAVDDVVCDLNLGLFQPDEAASIK